MEKNQKIHPAIFELKDDLNKGKLTRREFLRFATLLGMSAVAAGQMAGLAFPTKAFAAKKIKRGGILRVASPITRAKHPSKFDAFGEANMLRQVAEYLTYWDEENITHPYLLENWEVSEDLKTWTLNLRKGIKFSNGEMFTTDDIVFTMKEWYKKDVGSSMMGLMNYLDPGDIEKVDQFQVVLHLKRPEIAVPEHLFHYPAMMLNHKTFEGDFQKAPDGTGPYTLEKWVEGEFCEVKRRDDYWQKGVDGKPLPYMDGMRFIDMGSDMVPQIAAIKGKEVDMIELADASGTDVYQALKNEPGISIIPAKTSGTRVLRMRADVKPWDDNRVRMAMKLCQHREKILSLAYFGQGLLGHDTHVYPLHPEYCLKEIPKYDPQRAKQLLKEAGYPNGIETELTVGVDVTDALRMAEILQQDAAPAGIKINLNAVPRLVYWEGWTTHGFAITPWMHRPLGTMVYNLAYIGDDEGKPVPWNETRWVDKEFDQLVRQANGTLDVDERRKIFCKLEDIQMERGSIGIPFWRNQWMVTRKTVKDVQGHPGLYMLFNEVWLEG